MVRKNDLLLALKLTLPMVIFYLGYLFYHEASVQPTGFIQYDNVSYVAYGKQYAEEPGISLKYSNPFNDSSYTAIYFQPQSVLFALLLKAGVPPGWILIPFSFISAFICFLLIIRIHDLLNKEKRYRTLIIWLLAWGGGLLTLAGSLAYLFQQPETSFLSGIFILDPEQGWWGLNLGRSLFFTCEAYYHALFLGAVYFFLKRKWIAGLICVFALSLSHPFSGIELAVIVALWVSIEFIFSKKQIPWWVLPITFLIVLQHIYHYIFYLENFPDHKSVSEQYTLNWRLRFYRMIPAYFLVGLLAVFSIYKSRIRNFFKSQPNRLLACWFAGAFLLANHELFITAKQPIHFTRGYIWTSLFLLGIPALIYFIDRIKNKWGKPGLAVLAIIFFADNFLWIGYNVYSKANTPSAVYFTKEQKDVLQFVDDLSTNKTLIVSSDADLAYLSSVFTSGYPWYSHPYTTPFAARKKAALNQFIEKGIQDTAWKNREVYFILKRSDTVAIKSMHPLALQKETPNYLIFRQ